MTPFLRSLQVAKCELLWRDESANPGLMVKMILANHRESIFIYHFVGSPSSDSGPLLVPEASMSLYDDASSQ
jgi:hypothetical protein